MASYEISGLTFAYPKSSRAVLDDINVTIKHGEFVVLCGHSGCGKSTFLRHLKPILRPHGQKSGAILFDGRDVDELGQREQSFRIGFVMQSPENQTVTDKVWHELAFGLESSGEKTPAIRLRVAEMASFFGIQNWFHKPVSELSGGQKQLLNLASIMAMQPSVLILDEPTSQLDPIAASEFLATVGKIGRELGVTIIMTEHRLEDALPLCDRVLVMDKGKIIADGAPREVGSALKSAGHGMFMAFPTPMRIWSAVENELPCPVTVRDGREWISQIEIKNEPAPPEPLEAAGDTALELREVFFRYEKSAPDILKGMSLLVRKGELFALVGGNGTGKTTSLSLLAGLNNPQRGEVLLEGERNVNDGERFGGLLGVLPQNPQALFVKKTVGLDLLEMLSGSRMSREERERSVREIADFCELNDLLESHPYDLSGGEQQRAALAKILLTRPRILLLDEPTKGMDAQFKYKFARLLKELTASGVTVFMVSHDIEFCAEYADRIAMCFDGGIVSEGNAKVFFTGNSFYTTAANRMSRARLPGAVTAGDVISALGGKTDEVSDEPAEQERRGPLPEANKAAPLGNKPPETGGRRRIPAIIAAAVVFITTCFCAEAYYTFFTRLWNGDLARMLEKNEDNALSYVLVLVTLCVEAIALLMLCFPGNGTGELGRMPSENRKLPKRTLAAAAMVLLAIPLTIYIGVFYLGDRKYYFISLLIILETMLPFVLVFESRKPQARELVVIAVLCAIGVAGRAAFFMLPHFKPVAAMVIIAGVAFGGEAGFLVGAMTGFASNFFFGQGPWTPWQMFAYGIIGFLAGVLFKKGLLSRSRTALAGFGFFAAFVIYGGIMNPASVLMYQIELKPGMFWFAYLQGAPLDLVHAIATAFFLVCAASPMLEKLDRIKIKYGLIEP